MLSGLFTLFELRILLFHDAFFTTAYERNVDGLKKPLQVSNTLLF